MLSLFVFFVKFFVFFVVIFFTTKNTKFYLQLFKKSFIPCTILFAI